MGSVHAGQHVETGAEVALKVLLPAFAEDPDTRARFVREAESLRRLSHPHVVGYVGSGIQDDVFFLALERVHGAALDETVAQHPGGLGWDRTAALLRNLADVLVAAHQLGIVHRDLKPANVMQPRTGGLKVVDFGLALAGDELISTRDGTRMGSLLYASPEQNEGKKVDARADLYSLGVLGYEVLTGARPFAGDKPLPVLLAQLNETYEPPSHRRPEVPAGVDALFASLLRADRERRMPSAHALVRALADLGVPE